MDILTNALWLALCIFHEARGEPEAGQIAVAQVIMNRVEERGLSVEEIVKQPYQFSWVQDKPAVKFSEYHVLAKCFRSAYKCLEARMNGDVLKGANHYYNPHKVSPQWADRMSIVKEIGNHVFLRG